jgi:prolyl 4-hydroxylase
MHEGMPVVKGTKYIITKWFREARWLPSYATGGSPGAS